jgi:hypothetical protein
MGLEGALKILKNKPMGLYDGFKIAQNWLPAGKQFDPNDQDFQTKDLDCQLGMAEVLEDGKLYYAKFLDEGEDIRPHNHTGQIRFYDMKNEFVAWCVNGVVKEVVDITS